MNEFKDNYDDLKNNLNSENSKLISFLIYGIILGRLLEKYKKLRKNFKAGNYFAIATFFIIFGISSVLTQVFNGNYFIQAMVYFSMSFLCILAFSFIIWRLLKWMSLKIITMI